MNRIWIWGVLLIFLSCNRQSSTKIQPVEELGHTVSQPKKNAKNIILMIGDGTGLTQISAGMYAQGNQTSLEDFTSIGLSKTYAYDNLITDSAAGATALSCGVKTFNGAIGVDPDTNAVMTILEEAEQRNFKTGLISTSSITHATPASFIAHNASRRNYEAIAADFLDTDIDIFVGGGYKYFSRRESDDRNLIDEMEKTGYAVYNHVHNDIRGTLFNPDEKVVFFTADEEPLPVSNGRDYLNPAVEKTLEFLDKKSQDNGFFLMIEGSQIDWGGHANDGAYVVSEFIDFDHAINEVLDFANKNGETLVIVTADHETGGMAVQNGSKMDSLDFAFTSDYHTATMVPIFAKGPGEEHFIGIIENTHIYTAMRNALGWNTTKGLQHK